ncbi:hypothetical protein COY87_00745 [Candidatus Roizmanbacteria bacterium CG_4_10_14_0_8_um_filter_33_9]|uniref:Peptidase S9 prolyl oligopeptidase catalytic domain-containing protein n=1 Tax=Candidatus Roizmanbacteria bacterium CG_4_10_14_0_8_um_filter_33_9 TaxID=1974826 RepID=A0A2M7QJI8_9BACT|nr:MAG: hypothetical protein COY87_00745 [Candidatus Roizmanbacteria bacterium CG_4_10_14_0_8_um_filter_33_9]
MKKILFIIIVSFFSVILVNWFIIQQKSNTPSLKKVIPKEKPLLAYTFENLKKTIFPTNTFILGKIITETPEIITQIFYFNVPDKPDSRNILKVSGVINIPKNPGTYPIIVMFRGFIPEETYQPGAGTEHVAEVLAQNKFITLAPDFLGFGESSSPSKDSFEARFQTYTTALTLFSSLPNFNTALDASYSATIKADIDKVGIWAHSNGGHIALSVLAISGSTYPTVLWAPVSKSFPYSILYYTDESDDQGKALRKALALFENDYDAQLFSPERYYQWIKAPLSIHQGSTDREVPISWSDDLVDELKKDDIKLEYIIYPGADHNMLPTWSSVVKNSIVFYEDKLNNSSTSK